MYKIRKHYSSLVVPRIGSNIHSIALCLSFTLFIYRDRLTKSKQSLMSEGGVQMIDNRYLFILKTRPKS